MTIAFFSYEYPPDTGGGGIGTYLTQCVEWLPKYGHRPIVICGTSKEKAFWESEYVYRLPCTKDTYNERILDHFKILCKDISFDIAEGTDYLAWGLPVLEKFNNLPFCIKAHTSNFITDQYLYQPLSFFQTIRFLLGALRRFQVPVLPSPPHPDDYLFERKIVSESELVISPSNSLAEKYRKMGWNNNFDIVPYPFQREFNQTSLNRNELVIVFYGRLERRKGVLDLADAIPLVLKKHKNILFKFVGTPSNSPIKGLMMDKYLAQKLIEYKSHVSIVNAIPNSQLGDLFNEGDIFTFPSLYDNFPLVCLEAMAAGKAVIGSDSGGMAEIIENYQSGILVKPNSAKELAEKIIELIEDETLRASLGENAREAIKNKYAPQQIIPLQIEAYQKAISLHKKKVI